MTNNQCHLMTSVPSEDDLVPISLRFDVLKVYVDESHIFRYLLKCKKCPQLYFFEFYEEIDWEKGNDPQYSTYVPVLNIQEADKINNYSQLELLKVTPRLQDDFVKEKKTRRWIR